MLQQSEQGNVSAPGKGKNLGYFNHRFFKRNFAIDSHTAHLQVYSLSIYFRMSTVSCNISARNKKCFDVVMI